MCDPWRPSTELVHPADRPASAHGRHHQAEAAAATSSFLLDDGPLLLLLRIVVYCDEVLMETAEAACFCVFTVYIRSLNGGGGNLTPPHGPRGTL